MAVRDDDHLLSADNHSLLLIDHQSVLVLTTHSRETPELLNNVAFVAETTKIFQVPHRVLTGKVKSQGLVEPLGRIVADSPTFDRDGTLDSWDDERVPRWVQEQGSPKLVLAGLWTEVCVMFAALSALRAGYDVYVITDASGGATSEAHDMAMERMIQAGVKLLTAWVYASELQRNWSHTETAEPVTRLFAARGGAFGQALVWQWQNGTEKEGEH